MHQIRPAVTRLVVIAVAALALVACGGSTDARSPDEQSTIVENDGTSSVPEPGPGTGDRVYVDTFIFRPDPLRVPAGTTVTFEQLDRTTHTVTAGTIDAPEPQMFDVRLAEGETFSYTFDEPGVYPYFCLIHDGPGMEGEIIVE